MIFTKTRLAVATARPDADQADKWAKKRAIFDHMLRQLTKVVRLRRDWTIAEFGIGRWGFGRFYAPYVEKVYGIDIEDYADRHPGVEFVLSDGQTIPLPSASVDLVVSHSVLEHVSDLDASLREIDRITKPGGFLFLTVSPLYYSSYGAHLNSDGKRVENWEHLMPGTAHFLSANPLPDAATGGHSLNRLTSSMFLASVGRQPWDILQYTMTYEDKLPPAGIVRDQCHPLELIARGFVFIGQKSRHPATC